MDCLLLFVGVVLFALGARWFARMWNGDDGEYYYSWDGRRKWKK